MGDFFLHLVEMPELSPQDVGSKSSGKITHSPLPAACLLPTSLLNGQSRDGCKLQMYMLFNNIDKYEYFEYFEVFVRESVTWISVGKILSVCASLWIYSICVSSFKPNKYIVMTPFCQSFNNSAREADSGPTQVCSSESRFIYV